MSAYRSQMRDLLLYALSMVAVFVTAGCMTIADQLVEPIKVKVPDVSVKKLELTRAELNVKLRVTNPNKISATVSKLKYDIIINDKSVANGTYVKDVEIPADGTTETVVPIVVSNADLLKFLAKTVFTKGSKYRAKGDVTVGPLSVPFDEAGLITRSDL